MNRSLVRMVVALAALAVAATATATAQEILGPFAEPLGPNVAPTPEVPRPPDPIAADRFNPMRVLGDAARLIPGTEIDAATYGGQLAGGPEGPEPPTGITSRNEPRPSFSVALNIMILLTAITLVPSVMLMCTCFVRILIVLGLLRQAIGTQSVPPAQVVTALALFMTMMIMAPTVDRVWDEAITPWQEGEVADYGELWDRAKAPLRDFMFDQIDASNNWASVYTLLNYRGVDTSEPEKLTRADVDMTVLIPAYMLSELKIGFTMGFRVYLPFLVIDMVIASVLISMSMMMLPPVLISLPFKLLLFVMVDGWNLVVGSLLESFVLPERAAPEAAVLLLLPFCLRSNPPPDAAPDPPRPADEGAVRGI